MKISLQLSVLLFISTIYFACNSNKQEKDIAQIVTEWQGKEVIFPDDLVFTLFGKDTVDYNIPESNHKILLYVDSVGCTSCKLQLYEWGRLIEEVATLTSGSVPVLLFFHPKDSLHFLKTLYTFYREACFALPIGLGGLFDCRLF